jgi:hypothetical protein
MVKMPRFKLTTRVSWPWASPTAWYQACSNSPAARVRVYPRVRNKRLRTSPRGLGPLTRPCGPTIRPTSRARPPRFTLNQSM